MILNSSAARNLTLNYELKCNVNLIIYSRNLHVKKRTKFICLDN
jgi:hypothetical protein